MRKITVITLMLFMFLLIGCSNDTLSSVDSNITIVYNTNGGNLIGNQTIVNVNKKMLFYGL